MSEVEQFKLAEELLGTGLVTLRESFALARISAVPSEKCEKAMEAALDIIHFARIAEQLREQADDARSRERTIIEEALQCSDPEVREALERFIGDLGRPLPLAAVISITS